jgi:enoyl-CoA hydratase/carnithine racemase
MMTTETDILVDRAGTVLRITFNRPASLNAFSTEMLDRAAEAVESSGSDAAVRLVVLTGNGRAFSAGADLASEEADGLPGVDTIDAANRLTRAIREVPKPVLAAVNGPAVGVGCSFALAADITVSKESAYFLLAFANVGLMPDGGATALIPATAGRARAARMAFLAERIPAPLALDWGLITHVVADDAFDAEVEQLTTRLANGPTEAYARTKRAFNATALAALPQALDIEREGQSALFGTDDFAEGVGAFRGKRTPRFTGK